MFETHQAFLMAAVSPSPVHSPKRTVSIDLSKIEEKMANTPSQDSTAEVTVFPINAHKVGILFGKSTKKILYSFIDFLL